MHKNIDQACIKSELNANNNIDQLEKSNLITGENIRQYPSPMNDCNKILSKDITDNSLLGKSTLYREEKLSKPHKYKNPHNSQNFISPKCQKKNVYSQKHGKKHPKEKRFICEFPGCGKKFSAKFNLKVSCYFKINFYKFQKTNYSIIDSLA